MADEPTTVAPYKADTEVVQASAEVQALATQAKALVVDSPESEATGMELLGSIRTVTKGLKTLRDRWYKPLKKDLDAMAADFKALAAPAVEADPIVSEKLSAYRAEVERKAQAEQDRLRKIAERTQARRAAKAEEKGEEPPVVIPMAPTVAPPPKTAQTDAGTVTYVDRWHAEVIDARAVPREWCIPDEQRLGAAARSQVITPDNCPAGVRVYKTSEPSFRKRA